MKQWDTVAIVGVGLIGGSIGLGPAPAKSGEKRRRHRPPAGKPADGTPRRRRHPYHDRPEQRRGRGRTGHRLHAGRPDRRTRSPGRPALPRANADHRRRQRQAGDRRPPSTAGWPAAAASWAAIPWPAARRPAPATPRPTCSRAGWRSSRPPRTPGPRISICSKSSGSRSASVVVQMTPEEHDQALALTSHLPHVAAAALALAVPEKYFRLSGTGMLDTTRVAGGDPRALAADSDAQSRERADRAWSNTGPSSRPCTPPSATTTRTKSPAFSPSPRRTAMLWEVDIYAAEGQPDLGAATWPPRPPNCTWRIVVQPSRLHVQARRLNHKGCPSLPPADT